MFWSWLANFYLQMTGEWDEIFLDKRNEKAHVALILKFMRVKVEICLKAFEQIWGIHLPSVQVFANTTYFSKLGIPSSVYVYLRIFLS